MNFFHFNVIFFLIILILNHVIEFPYQFFINLNFTLHINWLFFFNSIIITKPESNFIYPIVLILTPLIFHYFLNEIFPLNFCFRYFKFWYYPKIFHYFTYFWYFKFWYYPKYFTYFTANKEFFVIIIIVYNFLAILMKNSFFF